MLHSRLSTDKDVSAAHVNVYLLYILYTHTHSVYCTIVFPFSTFI